MSVAPVVDRRRLSGRVGIGEHDLAPVAVEIGRGDEELE
jgi:hypothetical protein